MEDQSKYQELFISEALEHIDNLDMALIALEKNKGDKKILEELMRHSHTLKGMAASMNYGEISNLAHSFEGMLENMKNKISKGGTTLLFGALDELRRLVIETENGDGVQPANRLVDEVGELEETDQKTEEQIMLEPKHFRKLTEVRVRAEKLDMLMDLAAELLVNKLSIQTSFNKLGIGEQKTMERSVDENERLTNELQYKVLQLRLTPLSHVFNRFPRMVRDLAKKLGKEIELHVSGGDTEIDRIILDEIGEPILHLLRNAADHGIDKKGVVTLSAKKQKDKVVISVHNTGKVIDWDKLAIKKKEVKSKLSIKEFLFSGVSTAAYVTDVSGRGVGLGVVKDKIQQLRGSVEVSSNEKEGTVFSLSIPVSLAIIKALLFKVGGRVYAIPSSYVNRLIDMKDVGNTTQADQEVAVIDEKSIPLVRMKKIFSFADETDKDAILKNDNEVIMLVENKGKMAGLVVDWVDIQQDIIVKPLDDVLRKRKFFSSVTVLGDGSPVPILDVESLAGGF